MVWISLKRVIKRCVLVMSDIKINEWFNLPTTAAKFWLAPVQRDNGDRRKGQMKALVYALNSHDALVAKVADLEAKNKFLDFVVDEVATLIDSSSGVAGLHHNGDIAEWDSLLEGGHFEEWLKSLSKALEAKS